MSYANHIDTIRELAESEGIFTAAQAKRMGVTMNALSYAASHGILERVAFGAYRLVGSQSSPHDELIALWKLTVPGGFSHERIPQQSWDGVAVGGRTAANVLEIGDFEPVPYRIYTPKRFNSRRGDTSFKVRAIDRRDVSFAAGFPVTRPERTIVDMLLDHEDPSLVADAYRDALDSDFDQARFLELMGSCFKKDEVDGIFNVLGVETTDEEGEN